MKKVTIKHSIPKLIAAIALPLAVGGLSVLLAGGTNGRDYVSPPLTPPDWVFPIVWNILYIMLGIASYLIWRISEYKWNDALKSYCYQLFVNFCWPIVFFGFGYYTAAAVVLAVLILLTIGNTVEFFKMSKIAGMFLLPYLAWLIFALYINIGVVVLNS